MNLLLVMLGPVQDFIAQARRTRDLWFGSHLLSEVSRAAAATLVKRGARLIFPALEEGDDELSPSPGPLRASGKPALAIPNKILCVADDDDPEALAADAMRAAEARWVALATNVKRACSSLIATKARDAWDEQIQTFLELSAAWKVLPDEAGYAAARDDLERELAGRKLLRDFPAWHRQRGAVPKSSLDGARETVLAEPSERPVHLVGRYRINPNEQLDAVGLVKRAGGDPDQFVPIANVALAGWVAAVKERFPQGVAAIARVCEESELKSVGRRDLPCGSQLFAWDAEIFLKDRWGAILEEAAGEPEPTTTRSRTPQAADRVAAWKHRDRVQELLDKVNSPFPYVACLVADGDRMGRALDGMPRIEQHRTFSERLSYFAERARAIVEQEYRGILVYAGGDDVLGLINVAQALRCAEALRIAFAQIVRDALADAAPETPVPTLSVGLGIGHLLESMGQLRRLGGDAEKLAKTRRDALAVLVDKRSGGITSLLESWDDDPLRQIESAVALLENRQLSVKKVHEIGAELSRMPPRRTLLESEQTAWADLLRSEVERILARSGDGDDLTAPEVGLDFRPDVSYDARRSEVERWVSRMLVAKVIAEANHAARPKGRG